MASVNSMRWFATVAVSLDGTEHGRFEAVLEPLPGTAPDERTLEWFGNVEHTHKAIDDTVGFANLLVELSRRVDANLARGVHEGS